MSPIEHLLKQSTITRQVIRGVWDPFCVNVDNESKACCKICEKDFQGYIHHTVVSVLAYFNIRIRSISKIWYRGTLLTLLY